MLIDLNLVLSSAQAVTASAASTNVVDQGTQTDAVALGLWVEFLVNTVFTSNGATIAFSLQTATDEAFSSPVTLFSTAAVAVASLVAGYRVARVKVPLGALRFLRGYYTVASGPAAGGKVDTRLVTDVDVNLP